MSKVKQELIEDLRRHTGVDHTRVIDYLYQCGILDDCTVRRHVVRVKYRQYIVSSDRRDCDIHEEIGEDFGLSRSYVLRLVQSPNTGAV